MIHTDHPLARGVELPTLGVEEEFEKCSAPPENILT